MNCPKCGSIIPDSATFCTKCGAEFDEKIANVQLEEEFNNQQNSYNIGETYNYNAQENNYQQSNNYNNENLNYYNQYEKNNKSGTVSCAELRKRARESLRGKWGKAISICIFSSFIIPLIAGIIVFINWHTTVNNLERQVKSMPTAISSAENLLEYKENIQKAGENMKLFNDVISLVEGILMIPISFGTIVALTKLRRGEETGLSDVFKLGFKSFGKALVMSLTVGLTVILLGIISMIVIGISYSFIRAFSIIIVIALSIWLTSIVLNYTVMYNIAIDNPEMKSRDVMKKSKELMHGYRLGYVALIFTFFGWILLSSLTIGIGNIALVPYMIMTMICFYEHIKENPIPKK